MLTSIVKNSVRFALKMSEVGARLTDSWYDLGNDLNEQIDEGYIERREMWERKIASLKECYNRL